MDFKEVFVTNNTKSQILKALYALVFCSGLLFLTELVFQIPAVNKFFSVENLQGTSNNTTWLILWLLMFAQVTIIPIPAMPIYVFCNGTALVASGSTLLDLFSLHTLFFVIFVNSACIAGSIAAYGIGKLGGRKAAIWIAGNAEEYDKWTKLLNGKMGKSIYGLTVFLPIFPDDLLCLVMGAMKISFGYFVTINIIGKFIGTYCMLIFLRLPFLSNFFMSSRDGTFPISLVVYGILCILSLIMAMLWRRYLKKSCIK